MSDNNEIFNKVYQIRQLRCIRDGEEVSFRDIKNSIKNKEIDELFIFSISNRLYKQIINYLEESNIKYQIYGRSRIVLYF